MLLKSPDRTAALQLRYDRIDYPIKEDRAEMYAAERVRKSAQVATFSSAWISL